ncbi:hypothetical protein CDO73_19760 [Saccharibacillus sp. O23]|uniref:DUF4129 domain-containing protein n=1 Tax=Saccharibacillus sp. O23 TaxID=2009338 RepID=UPI000B4E3A4D|nr:DUF4129 domain-containing protein [Saccharibacillus sp. O23]OWR28120.1 hypothetical protein CDO73_19760 [Saccharibacillus sp. O23]
MTKTKNGEVTERSPLLRGFGRPAAYSLLEIAAAYAPVAVLAHYAVRQPDLLLILPMLLLHAGGSLIGLRQAEGRAAGWMAALPFVIALLLALAIPGGLLARGVAAALLLLSALRGLLVGRRQLWDNMWVRIPMTGIAAMFVLYIVAGRVPELAGYRPQLYLLSVVLLALTLLLVNGDRVRNEAGAETSALSNILTANRRLTWIVAAFIVLAGMIGGPTGILNAIRRWWLSLFAGGTPQGAPVPESPGMPSADYSELLEMGEKQETPLWLKIIGYAFQTVFWALVAALALWLLYRLFGRWLPNGIRNLVRKIAARLGLMREMRAVQSGASYTDRAEKLSAEETGKRKRRFRFGSGRREAEYAGDDPRLRYRSVVLQALRKGLPFVSSRTPAETGKELAQSRYTELSPSELDQLVERYNQARYGEKE